MALIGVVKPCGGMLISWNGQDGGTGRLACVIAFLSIRHPYLNLLGNDI